MARRTGGPWEGSGALLGLFLGNKLFSIQNQSGISAGLRQICNALIVILFKDASFSGNLTHITVVTIPENMPAAVKSRCMPVVCTQLE
jgi:hypothetical protein